MKISPGSTMPVVAVSSVVFVHRAPHAPSKGPGCSIAHPRPTNVTGKSQPSSGSAMKCSMKLNTNMTMSVGTMKASHADSRGKSRRKNTAPPMTW